MRVGGDTMKIETTTFSGPFAINIKKYLEEKKAIGNKIEGYIYSLKSFDTFTKENNLKSNILTKDLLNDWLKLRLNEKRTNQASRATIIRGFSIYTGKFNHITKLLALLSYLVHITILLLLNRINPSQLQDMSILFL